MCLACWRSSWNAWCGSGYHLSGSGLGPIATNNHFQIVSKLYDKHARLFSRSLQIFKPETFYWKLGNLVILDKLTVLSQICFEMVVVEEVANCHLCHHRQRLVVGC